MLRSVSNYGTGKSTSAEMIARDRGADFDDIHFVRVNGSQFGDVRKSSLLQNAMQWGIINHKTPVLIVDEVDVLSKESQIGYAHSSTLGSIVR